MNQDWKKKWLTALRSGEYKQGKGRLRTENVVNHYCCLGVLADIADPQGWGKDGNHRHQWGTLNLTLRGRVRLSFMDQYHLMKMNDSDKRFTTIAKWIEENL